MSISIEYCYSRLELVRCLKEAALFFALFLKWLILPSHGWWWPSPSPSPYSEDTAAAAEDRARCRAAAVRANLRVTTYEDLVEVTEEVRSAGVAVGVTCAVCLTEVAARAVVWELTSCWHVFHKGCLDRWIDHDEHLSCPLCRAALLPAQQLPSPPPAEPSWAVEHLLYFFGDDHLLTPPP